MTTVANPGKPVLVTYYLDRDDYYDLKSFLLVGVKDLTSLKAKVEEDLKAQGWQSSMTSHQSLEMNYADMRLSILFSPSLMIDASEIASQIKHCACEIERAILQDEAELEEVVNSLSEEF